MEAFITLNSFIKDQSYLLTAKFQLRQHELYDGIKHKSSEFAEMDQIMQISRAFHFTIRI